MTTFKAHEKPIYGLAFSPDGESLLTSSGDEMLRLWGLNPVALKQEWPGSGYVCPVAISPDGKYVARGGRQTSVWEIGASVKPLIVGNFTEAVAFSPDGGKFVMHGNSCEELRRWSLPKWKELAGGWGGSRGGWYGFPTGGMAYSPDCKLLATTFGFPTPKGFVSVVYLWNASTGKKMGQLNTTVRSEHPTSLCFSPNGKLLAGASGAIMRIWDVGKKKEIANLNPSKKYFKGQVFSHDGKTLLTVGQDDLVTRWEVKGWKKVEEIDGDAGKLTAIARTPDAANVNRYAVGGVRGRVGVWEE